MEKSMKGTKMKEKYETCKHAKSAGALAVFVEPTCPELTMIKGTLVSSKSRCRKCRKWEPKDEHGNRH